MSTIKVINAQHPSASAANIVLDSSGNFTSPGSMVAGSSYAWRNRIINGDCRIDQRNAGAAVTANNSFPVDRFAVTNGTNGAFSAQQDSSAPSGFDKSVKITITTADTSLAATQVLTFLQRIEGFNMADFAWGTASAKTVTLSFWVRSSLTGTFGGSLRNSPITVSYPFSYTISAADTWEYKTITITGSTSGTWLTDNNIGIVLAFSLGSGTDRSGIAGAWNNNNNASATGAVSVVGTLNATWYITGVQLEVGSAATPFERRDYGRELILCQRYFETTSGYGSAYMGGSGTTRAGCVYYQVNKRSAPTLTTSSISYGNASNLLLEQTTSTKSGFYYTSSGAGQSSASFDLAASAEL